MGDFETGLPGSVESTLKYHPDKSGELTCFRDPEGGQCLVGSLTGAVASQNVTEAREGSLSLIGNQAQSVMAQGSLTATPTSGAGTKVGHSDPAVLHGRAVAHRTKGTLGITG